jgi:hypothetical protein
LEKQGLSKGWMVVCGYQYADACFPRVEVSASFLGRRGGDCFRRIMKSLNLPIDKDGQILYSVDVNVVDNVDMIRYCFYPFSKYLKAAWI